MRKSDIWISPLVNILWTNYVKVFSETVSENFQKGFGGTMAY